MTEGWVDHNGGTAEMPTADPPARRRAKKTRASASGDTPRREAGSWFGWNAAGKWVHYGSELAAAQWALTPPADGATVDAPPSVEFVKYGAEPSR